MIRTILALLLFCCCHLSAQTEPIPLRRVASSTRSFKVLDSDRILLVRRRPKQPGELSILVGREEIYSGKVDPRAMSEAMGLDAVAEIAVIMRHIDQGRSVTLPQRLPDDKPTSKGRFHCHGMTISVSAQTTPPEITITDRSGKTLHQGPAVVERMSAIPSADADLIALLTPLAGVDPGEPPADPRYHYGLMSSSCSGKKLLVYDTSSDKQLIYRGRFDETALGELGLNAADIAKARQAWQGKSRPKRTRGGDE